MSPGRVLAVDPGDARVGLALSDETRAIVGRALTLQVRGDLARVVREIASLAAEEGVTQIVVGLPRNMDGTEGIQAGKARELARLLTEATELPTRMLDERLTTWQAHRILRDSGRRGRKGRRLVDAVAASVLLEDYLQSAPGDEEER